jgi:hypothetical protein
MQHTGQKNKDSVALKTPDQFEFLFIVIVKVIAGLQTFAV